MSNGMGRNFGCIGLVPFDRQGAGLLDRGCVSNDKKCNDDGTDLVPIDTTDVDLLGGGPMSNDNRCNFGFHSSSPTSPNLMFSEDAMCLQLLICTIRGFQHNWIST